MLEDGRLSCGVRNEAENEREYCNMTVLAMQCTANSVSYSNTAAASQCPPDALFEGILRRLALIMVEAVKKSLFFTTLFQSPISGLRQNLIFNNLIKCLTLVGLRGGGSTL